MPHDVLIRYLTYCSETIDSRKYVVESDLPHEEWYTDCCDYAASETDEERYMHAKCMQVPKGAWHTVEVIEPSVIFEAKDGAYVKK